MLSAARYGLSCPAAKTQPDEGIISMQAGQPCQLTHQAATATRPSMQHQGIGEHFGSSSPVCSHSHAVPATTGKVPVQDSRPPRTTITQGMKLQVQPGPASRPSRRPWCDAADDAAPSPASRPTRRPLCSATSTQDVASWLAIRCARAYGSSTPSSALGSCARAGHLQAADLSQHDYQTGALVLEMGQGRCMRPAALEGVGAALSMHRAAWLGAGHHRVICWVRSRTWVPVVAAANLRVPCCTRSSRSL